MRASHLLTALMALGVAAALVVARVRAPGEAASPARSPAARSAGGAPTAATPAPTAGVAPTFAMPSSATGPGLDAPDGAAVLEQVLAPEATLDTWITALAAEDPTVVAESVNQLVARRATAALPALLDQDVIARPRAAPSLIYAVGKLGAAAGPAARAEAVARLIALLREERQRGAQESAGNLLQIYEALGDTGDPAAVPPLEAELRDPEVATAPKVVIVEALVALRARGSRGVLEQVAAQLSPLARGEDFEAELRRELIAAIARALEQLS